eukprot:TRINITY_DN4236_c1_g2_i3.p1 TRINITY_DN4236_c1_g2~~TRINITY_DN4236_c1_g2_i3.p1  ORF type:complete len:379 (+),score=17.87 TRINITY_DN4236_c1_g2_i3:346-1482(+)
MRRRFVHQLVIYFLLYIQIGFADGYPVVQNFLSIITPDLRKMTGMTLQQMKEGNTSYATAYSTSTENGQGQEQSQQQSSSSSSISQSTAQANGNTPAGASTQATASSSSSSSNSNPSPSSTNPTVSAAVLASTSGNYAVSQSTATATSGLGVINAEQQPVQFSNTSDIVTIDTTPVDSSSNIKQIVQAGGSTAAVSVSSLASSGFDVVIDDQIRTLIPTSTQQESSLSEPLSLGMIFDTILKNTSDTQSDWNSSAFIARSYPDQPATCPSQSESEQACPFQDGQSEQANVTSLYHLLMGPCNHFELVSNTFLSYQNCCQELKTRWASENDMQLMRHCSCNSFFRCHSDLVILGLSQGNHLQNLYDRCGIPLDLSSASC